MEHRRHRETGDRKRRDKFTGENKQHLEGVETITRTGATDQGVIGRLYSDYYLWWIEDRIDS